MDETVEIMKEVFATFRESGLMGEMAQLLWEFKQQLVAAGFTESEAMSIVTQYAANMTTKKG